MCPQNLSLSLWGGSQWPFILFCYELKCFTYFQKNKNKITQVVIDCLPHVHREASGPQRSDTSLVKRKSSDS